MTTIPKKIHFCWLSGDPFPELIERCIASWKEHLHDYEFVLWDLQRFDIEQVPWVKEAFEARKYAFAADYIRLYAVHREGGIYLDADVEVLKRFDDLLDQPSFIGFETSGDLEPAIFGAPKGCAWVAECLRHYEGRHFARPDGSRDTTPLPLVVEERLRAAGLMLNQVPVTEPVARPGVTFYPAEFFSPKNVHSKAIRATRRTYAIHHLDGQWVERRFSHRVKQTIHRVLHLTVGPANHRRIVKALRAAKK